MLASASFSFDSILRWIEASVVWHAVGSAFRANPILTIGAVIALIIVVALVRKSRKGKRRPARRPRPSASSQKYNAPKERTMTAAQWEKEQQLKDKNRN